MVDHAPDPPPRGAPACRTAPVEPGRVAASRGARRQRRRGVHRVPHRRCGRGRRAATERSAPRGSPGSRPVRCRWRSGSTCRWRASATSSRPTCASSARPWRSTRWPSCGSWPRSGRRGASSPSWPWRWPASSPSKDALAAHARDELGLTEDTAARPVQAAAGVGGGLHARGARAAGGVPRRARRRPLRARLRGRGRGPRSASAGWVPSSGSASRLRAMARVGLGGAAAMGITLLIGELTGAALG